MSTPRGAVVITGASTGIGRHAAVHLAGRGFRVFAGVRKDRDAEAVAADGCEPVIVDVTRPEQVEAAVETVSAALGDDPLVGLVNNAGIAGGGAIELIPMDDLRWVFEVNVFGLVRATQAFLPLLRPHRGRVLNVSSLGGKISAPFSGPYSATKFAVEALSDSLRLELQPWGMHVVLIEPGRIESAIWDKAQDLANDVRGTLSDRAAELYGDALERMQEKLADNGRRAAPTVLVSRAIEEALTATTPKTRYVVGKDAKLAVFVRGLLPDRAMDWLVRRDYGLD